MERHSRSFQTAQNSLWRTETFSELELHEQGCGCREQKQKIKSTEPVQSYEEYWPSFNGGQRATESSPVESWAQVPRQPFGFKVV